ncbi:MAG: hypothetical protein B7C24_06960 [Bacteroidetes bacterium 4572_77]|jgi:hypothetical protein|nr:MAG: hypothetical protein B7C24_06960 [Bacteroidetes bacterium 4572_77]
MLYNHILKFDDILLEVVRVMSPQYFVTDPKSNQMNQQLLGMWVHHLGADRVVRKEGKILICKVIEDAIIVE